MYDEVDSFYGDEYSHLVKPVWEGNYWEEPIGYHKPDISAQVREELERGLNFVDPNDYYYDDGFWDDWEDDEAKEWNEAQADDCHEDYYRD